MQTRRNTQTADNQIFKALDILRSSGQPLETYDLIFFFLLMKKVGWLEKIVIDDFLDFTRQIPQIGWKDNTKSGKALLEVYFALAEELELGLSYETKLQLIRFFSVPFQKESYGEMFDLLFSKIKGDILGKAFGEGSEPMELSKLMASIYPLMHNAKTYNPFAGSAPIATYLPSHVSYYGQEVDTMTWALGQMRLIAHNKLDHAQIVQGNPVSDWRYENNKYDFIVASPPLNHKVLDRNWVGQDLLVDPYADTFFIRNSLRTLSENGKAVLLVSNAFLFRTSNYDLRKYLVENDLLDFVIGFPGSILPHTSVPITILGINLSKAHKGKIHFINAEDLVIKEKRKTFIKVEEVLKYLNDQGDSEITRLVEINEIRDEGYNLSVNRYIYEEITGGVPLGELLTIYSGRREKGNKSGKYIRIGELNSNPDIPTINTTRLDNATIDLNQLEVSDCIPDTAVRAKGKLLLISKRFQDLKPCFVEIPEEETVYISNDVAAFTYNEDYVDPFYLILILHEKYVKKQIDRYRQGIAMPYISKTDFLKVKVKLPSLLEQGYIVNGTNQHNFVRIYEENELEKKIAELKKQAYADFSYFNHSLGKYMNSLSSGITVLEKFLKKKEGEIIDLDIFISEKQKVSLSEHIENIREKANLASKMIFSFKDGSQFEEPSQEEDFTQLLQRNIKRVMSSSSYDLKWGIDIFDFIIVDEKGEHSCVIPMIKANDDTFSRLLIEITDNIKNHGFKDRNNNIIRVEAYMKYDQNERNVFLEIANNGWPLNKGFGKDQLVERGYKSPDSKGSGMGGTIIRKIVDSMKGELDIVSDENEIFPVKYILTFPISSIQ
jgi:type I restriction enzyme M protein